MRIQCDACEGAAATVVCCADEAALALFCRDCDEPIHVPGTLSGNHQRYLATGIRVGFSSVCSANADHLPPPVPKSNNSKPQQASSVAAAVAPKPAVSAPAQEVPSSPFLPSPSGWAKGSPLGFKDLEWLDDIDLFHVPSPVKGGNACTAAEVPEFFASPQTASNMGFYKTSGARQSKKARVEIPDDDEDFFIVPDLGLDVM
uniref:B box-type domain-containing protein n=1 Tax=Leersia perrieri TaxID=77586 RepID=A0A0D9W6M3_9ORYZ